jgi:hypothetical protein
MCMYILNYKQSILFEIFEINLLLILVVNYILTHKYILSILYVVPLIEHIRQVKCEYRQKGGSLIDYITLFYLIGITAYSFVIQDMLSFIVALSGTVIHLITIHKRMTFSRVVGRDDIKKYINNIIRSHHK